MSKRKKNIALIGFGMWGKNLARNYYDLKALKFIYDADAHRILEAEKVYPDIEVTTSIDEIMRNKSIDGVVIATPPMTHTQIALEALKHDKNVFVEKPLAMSVTDGAKIVQKAKEMNKILMVGHVLEYHPAIIKLRDLIEKSELGKIQYIYSHRLNFGRIRIEENALWSFAPHDTAIILRLMGSLPQSITCNGNASLNHNIADNTVTTMNFDNGVQAHIFVSWLHPFKVHRLVIIGEKQMAVFDDTRPWDEKLILYPHQVEWAEGRIPVARRAEGVHVQLEEKEPLSVECQDFLNSMNTGKHPLTDGDSAIKVLQVLESAQLSMQSQHDKSELELAGTHDVSDKPYFVHPKAMVDESAQIGDGTKVWHFTHIMRDSKIGKKCVLGQNVHIARNVRIGDGVKIQNNVSVYEGVKLEDFVFCGPSVVFTNVINPRSEIERKSEYKTTIVKKGATLGANATILCGITLGKYSFVGAGAVVTKDVPDFALVIGNPARIKGWMCACGTQLKFSKSTTFCKSCKKKYRQSKDKKKITLL